MKDVAKQANVSIATVSHVINKTRYVSPELVERVKSAMESLDYKPNNTARDLRSNKVKSIGLIIPDISSPFFLNIVKSVEKVAAENGYGLIVCNTRESEHKFEMYIKLMAQYKVDGLLIAPTCECLEHVNELQNCNVPFVFIDRSVKGIKSDSVISDNMGGAYKATRHLIKSGHEKIALMIGNENITSNKEKIDGYKKALGEHNIDFDSQMLVVGKCSEEDAASAFDELMRLENKPTAVLCADNTTVMGVVKEMLNKGYECPKDISLIAYGDFDWAPILIPPITVIEQEPEKIGLNAAKLLFDKLNNIQHDLKEFRIPTKLNVRKSTQVIGRGPFGEMAVHPEVLELTDAEVEQVRSGNYSAAICFHYSGNAWARLHEKGIKDEFDRLGIKVLAVTDAHFNPELQIRQHESLLSMEPDIIISIPTDEIKTSDSYKKIVESKVKLVLITNVPRGLTHKDYVTCVSVNEIENGQICGRILGEYLSKNGKNRVGIIKHGAPFFATRQRDSAAEQVIRDEFPNLDIIAKVEFLKENMAYETCYNMVKAHPEIEGIYVSWDGPAIKVVNALYDLNREDIAVVTSDLDFEVAMNMAKGGIIKGISSQRPYEQGRSMALAAANALIQKEVPPFIGVQPYCVTRNNLLKAWQDIIKENPPVKLVNALRSNPNFSLGKKLIVSGQSID